MFRLQDWPPGVWYAAFWDTGPLIIQTGDLMVWTVAPSQLANHLSLGLHWASFQFTSQPIACMKPDPAKTRSSPRFCTIEACIWMNACPSVSQLSACTGIGTWHSTEKNDSFKQVVYKSLELQEQNVVLLRVNHSVFASYLCLWIY